MRGTSPPPSFIFGFIAKLVYWPDNSISISGGTAGTAEADALAVFSAVDLKNPETVSQADLDFMGDVNDVANDAETDAYNVAIAAATGDAKVALQNAKIQNKVLKLEATVLQLTIQAAQGKNTAAKLAAETKKLQNNIALDKKAAGQPATKLTFDATIG